jgi:probable rRNA maturation factor
MVKYALRTGKRLRVEAAEQTMKDVRLHLGFSHCSVGLWVTSRSQMSGFNKELRRMTGATDVISVPNLEFDRPKVVAAESLAMHDLGDILLCLAVVEKDAVAEGETLDARFQELLVHSMLHLVGYDHLKDEDFEKMEVEEKYFAELLGKRKYFD